jgi:hypothetical protein
MASLGTVALVAGTQEEFVPLRTLPEEILTEQEKVIPSKVFNAEEAQKGYKA